MEYWLQAKWSPFIKLVLSVILCYLQREKKLNNDGISQTKKVSIMAQLLGSDYTTNYKMIT